MNKKDDVKQTVKVKVLKPLNYKDKTVDVGAIIEIENDENLNKLIKVDAVAKIEESKNMQGEANAKK